MSQYLPLVRSVLESLTPRIGGAVVTARELEFFAQAMVRDNHRIALAQQLLVLCQRFRKSGADASARQMAELVVRIMVAEQDDHVRNRTSVQERAPRAAAASRAGAAKKTASAAKPKRR